MRTRDRQARSPGDARRRLRDARRVETFENTRDARDDAIARSRICHGSSMAGGTRLCHSMEEIFDGRSSEGEMKPQGFIDFSHLGVCDLTDRRSEPVDRNRANLLSLSFGFTLQSGFGRGQ